MRLLPLCALVVAAGCSENTYVITRADVARVESWSRGDRRGWEVDAETFDGRAPRRLRADAVRLHPELASGDPDRVIAQTRGVHPLTAYGLGVLATGVVLAGLGGLALEGSRTHFPENDLPCNDGGAGGHPWQCSFHDGGVTGYTLIALGAGGVVSGGLMVALGLGRDPAEVRR